MVKIKIIIKVSSTDDVNEDYGSVDMVSIVVKDIVNEKVNKDVFEDIIIYLFQNNVVEHVDEVGNVIIENDVNDVVIKHDYDDNFLWDYVNEKENVTDMEIIEDNFGD